MTSKPDITSPQKPVKSSKAAKKAPAKRSTRRKKSRKKKQTFTAMYVLSIMVLLSIILILAGRLSHQEKNMGRNIARQSLPVSGTDGAVGVKFPEKSNPAKSSTPVSEKKNLAAEESKTREKKVEKSVKVEKNPDLVEVKVYLSKINHSSEKVSIIPVKRTVSKKDTLRKTFEKLIAGPTRGEINGGFINPFPAGLKINKVSASKGILYIDFNSKFTVNAFGDIIVNRINLLLLTARQFSGVRGITLRVNGKNLNAMGGDGRMFHWPIRRRL